jgi:hypothetical protein
VETNQYDGMVMTDRIRKAVFPVGGMGTRFLPATKAKPKEMSDAGFEYHSIRRGTAS